jgi:DNA-binding response OmpR family regulator
LFRVMIQGQGIVFRAVDDGRKALEVARDWQPDLVVLDVNMPILDGFQVLTALKSDETTKDTPVIMMTGSNQDSQILRGLRLGAKDYVVKPFNAAAVLERIRQLRTQKIS